MRIGIFCDSFYPENKAVAIRLYHLAAAFADVPSVQVAVHTSTGNAVSPRQHLRVIKNVCGAPSNIASNTIRLLSEVLLGTEMFLRILFSNYHLVLLTSPPFIASFSAVVAAKVRGIPYIFDVRDEYPEVFFSSGIIAESSFAGKILTAIEKFIYRNAFVVATVTQGICNRIDRKVNRQGFTMLVRNGFDEDLFSPRPEKEKNFTVIFHGNIGKFQDPDLIISLAKKSAGLGKTIKFKIIGYGNNDQRLKENKLENVEFLGMIDYAQIPAIISRAHLGISFRTSDTVSQNSFPVKLYEYIGVGIPVIITPVSEAGHFFESNKIGFQYDPSAEDSIISKIIELSENTHLLDQLTARVISVRKAFSRQQISNSFVSRTIESYTSKWKKS